MEVDKIRFLGRHINKEGREYFSFSGSGFEFAVVPQSKSCVITLILTSELREHDCQYLGVYVNDSFYSKEKLSFGLNKVILKIDDIQKCSTLRIIKYNEAYLSAIYLEDILLEGATFGELKPNNKKLIGFFGDSITCGYGLIDYQGTEFKMETEEFDKGYAFLASKKLNMDYLVVARSGISIGIKIWVDKLFNEIYDTVDMYEKCSTKHNLDYAVIYLGTNDQSAYYQLSEVKKKAIKNFRNEYHKLLDQIIRDNPNVKIVLCYNMISLTDLFINEIKENKKYIESHYKICCKLVEFESDNNGSNSHPYVDAHRKGAKKLVEAIKSF